MSNPQMPIKPASKTGCLEAIADEAAWLIKAHDLLKTAPNAQVRADAEESYTEIIARLRFLLESLGEAE